MRNHNHRVQTFRTFRSLPQVVYHGTSSDSYEKLNNNVLIEECLPLTDFGKGFYLTSRYDQASKHARYRLGEGEQPIVFHYEIDLGLLKNGYGVKTFPNMDIEWAKFVLHNRSEKFFEEHSHNAVYGGLADGKMGRLMSTINELPEIDDDVYTFFLDAIKKYTQEDQMSVHNQLIFTQNIIKQVKVSNAGDKNSIYIPQPKQPANPKTPTK
ncbi:DUF3990 domain-containing protein [Priestia megaterium]